MDSVEKQTFRDIEYIIINDGSTESIDDIVRDFMEASELPVTYVKKPNGGVHTARNVGFRMARGTLIMNIDSDDELLPNACETFYRAWMSIPEERRNLYWEMVAQCVDSKGQISGALFPENVNAMPREKALKVSVSKKGDYVGCWVASIMKENLFPEPEGVTLVAETVLWRQLQGKYLSWRMNEVALICHTEGMDHYTVGLDASKRKIPAQVLRNKLWSDVYRLNRREIYFLNFREYGLRMLHYSFIARLLEKTDRAFVKANPLYGAFNRICAALMYLPSMLGTPFFSLVYRIRKMKGR